MDGLPLTVGLAGREVLLVGAGPVSARRAETFLEAGAVLKVVAPARRPGHGRPSRSGRPTASSSSPVVHPIRPGQSLDGARRHRRPCRRGDRRSVRAAPHLGVSP
ncbi:hypothetical protein DQ226_10345, partial [Dietzia maris]